MSEVNEGVQIILNRMESNPEEFFGDSGKWNWMYKETMRDVMTEPEKAAIHVALTKVRRLELTAKAVATVLPDEEEKDDYGFGKAPIKQEAMRVSSSGSLGIGTQTFREAMRIDSSGKLWSSK